MFVNLYHQVWATWAEPGASQPLSRREWDRSDPLTRALRAGTTWEDWDVGFTGPV